MFAFVLSSVLGTRLTTNLWLRPHQRNSWEAISKKTTLKMIATDSFFKKDMPQVVIELAESPQDIDSVYELWNHVLLEDGASFRVEKDGTEQDMNTKFVLARKDNEIIGAGKLRRTGTNCCFEGLSVRPEWREKKIGTKILNKLFSEAGHIEGAAYVQVTKTEYPFYYLKGFDLHGPEEFDERRNQFVRFMLHQPPQCVQEPGCVGHHHTSIYVANIEETLAFYGILGLYVGEKYIKGGSRACLVEGLGTRIEFVENKKLNPVNKGIQGLVFDVTKASVDLEIYMKHLKRLSGDAIEYEEDKFNQRVLGNHMITATSIDDPNGLQIQFIRREATLPQDFSTYNAW